MSFPLAFWVLIYSIPLVVCTCIILCISFNFGNGKKCKDKDNEQNDRKTKTAAEDSTLDRSRTSFKRVHSVRRRRAKDISTEDNTQHNNVEEKDEISSTNLNNHDMVDKNALREESPKEIREVEVDISPASNTKGSCQSSTRENKDEGYDQKENLKGLDDEEEVKDNKNYKATQGNEDDQKNSMDVGISNMERSKRLESLIARRRSRKLLSLQVRKTLLNKDKDDKSGQISSIIIPKHNNPLLFYDLATPFSPCPGSAPSVLIPMRNPFDLPYDPQEEKPDLTGDSFQQEFMSVNKDVMFCRHESFSLGSCLPGKLDNNLEEMSMVHDFGFIQRASPNGHRFSRSKSEVDRAYAPMVEQGSFEVFQSKPSTEYPVDYIKEVIEVYDNSTQDHAEQNNDEVQIKPVPEERLSSSSPSSSEEDVPTFKIDKEAILKSLSSMARRNVSEVSSPPLTIDENFSYQDETASTHVKDMEANITSDIGDMWAGSSDRFGADGNEVNEVNKQDSDEYGFSRTNSLEEMITLSNSTEESLNEKYCIQSSLHSPSNVKLHKSCQAEATDPHEKESSEPSQVATVEVDDAESISKEKIPESGIKPQEAANSSSKLLSGHEASMEMVNQTNNISSRPFGNNDEVSIDNFQAVGPTASSKDKDFDNSSSSSHSTEKELSEHQEKVIEEVTCADDSNKSKSYKNHSENSALLEETRHEDSWKKPKDHEIQKNSASSNCSIGAVKEELPKFSGNETPIDLSGSAEATDSSESYTKNDDKSKDKQHDNSHVPMLVAEGTLEIINTFDGKPEQPITCTKSAQEV
ncbi:UNVERIFIED_CONTAM: hypothetical protein Sradi_0167000 [Sesamum radiatum]|uniref:Uncharacterized protein n=1 Tax=Sesamum radiatum TaxID=300843 RepID=A0AAW2W342_SESRA